jgi:hypothetical protein
MPPEKRRVAWGLLACGAIVLSVVPVVLLTLNDSCECGTDTVFEQTATALLFVDASAALVVICCAALLPRMNITRFLAGLAGTAVGPRLCGGVRARRVALAVLVATSSARLQEESR